MPVSPRRRASTGIGVVALVGALLASGSYASLTLLAPLEPVVASVTQHPLAAPTQPELAFPDYGGSAIAAIGYPDARITRGIETPMQLASITKVITSLVVLDAKPVSPGAAGPSLTFGQWDVGRYRYHLNNNGS